jgi:hypothetical protein
VIKFSEMRISVVPLLLMLLLIMASTASAFSESSDDLPRVETVLDKMKTHEEWQDRHLLEYQVRRTFYAANARFNLDSTLEVNTVFKKPNSFDSEIVRTEGSKMIREKVFDKILEAEKDAKTKEAKATAITPENYFFSMIGAETCDGRSCYRMRIVPKRKDRFSVDGQIWVDAEDGAIARIQGSPAKRPSFWTLHTEIDRRYKKIDGAWLCEEMESKSDILIGGHSTLKVDHSYMSVVTQKQSGS